jgi:hypothetical protein
METGYAIFQLALTVYGYNLRAISGPRPEDADVLPGDAIEVVEAPPTGLLACRSAAVRSRECLPRSPDRLTGSTSRV